MTTDILPADAGPAARAAAVFENLFDLFRATQALPGGELVETARMSCHHAFPSNPMFKGVWRVHLAPEEVDDAVDEALAWFRARQAPYAFWWLGPDRAPAGLEERLQALGFDLNIPGDRPMAARLDALADGPVPEGLTVVRVADRKAMEDWRDVFAAAFEIPLFAAQGWVDATLALGFDRAPWQAYVGYWHGRPVSTNLLFGGGGAVGLYAIATVAEARGRGIGAALTRLPLADARAQGYEVAVLYASEMGYPVYRRLGFEALPGRVRRYLWWNR
jgi:ribosomal protein S18 acetylase RimI-like enzyme